MLAHHTGCARERQQLPKRSSLRTNRAAAAAPTLDHCPPCMVFLRIRRISLRPQPATRRASQRHYRRVPPSSAAFPGCPQSSYGVCPNHITSLTPVRKCFSVLPRWLISVRSSTHHFAYLFYHMDYNNSSFLNFFP